MRALPHPHLGGQLTPRGLECIGTVRVNNGKDAVVIDKTTTWTLKLTVAEWEELLSSGVRKIDVAKWSTLEIVVDSRRPVALARRTVVRLRSRGPVRSLSVSPCPVGLPPGASISMGARARRPCSL